VESCCELGNEPSGSIKCWKLPSGCTTCGLSSGTQLHIVSFNSSILEAGVFISCIYYDSGNKDQLSIQKRINRLACVGEAFYFRQSYRIKSLNIFQINRQTLGKSLCDLPLPPCWLDISILNSTNQATSQFVQATLRKESPLCLRIPQERVNIGSIKSNVITV
jgi:hypothetical protein